LPWRKWISEIHKSHFPLSNIHYPSPGHGASAQASLAWALDCSATKKWKHFRCRWAVSSQCPGGLSQGPASQATLKGSHLPACRWQGLESVALWYIYLFFLTTT
jgi:hypothetical protein